MAWNPLMADLKAYNSCASILLASTLKVLNLPFHFINVYEPFVNRKQFLDLIKDFGLLLLPNLILARDLNFTWSSDEVWGDGHIINPLAGYFESLWGCSLIRCGVCGYDSYLVEW